MALNRAPTGIQVNGAALLIKGDAAGLFSQFQRVPGLANYTLPDETGSTNETQLMDGSIAQAQIAGVGTITGSIGAVSGHPTHDWLASKRRSGDAITVTIIRPAIAINREGVVDGAVAVAAAVDDGQTAAKDIYSVVTLDAADASIREGMIAAVHTAAPKGFELYSGAAGATIAKFQSIVKVNEGGTKFSITPGASGAISKATGTKLYARRAGILYANISCTVAGLGDGDFQAGASVGSNITLQPSEALPAKQTEWRLASELGASGFVYGGASSSGGDYDGAFADLS